MEGTIELENFQTHLNMIVDLVEHFVGHEGPTLIDF
jgi:hypothetical protein